MFFHLEVDLDQDQYAGLSAERLFSYIERLAAYTGAVAARIHLLQEEEKKRNPSHKALDQGAEQAELGELAWMGEHETV